MWNCMCWIQPFIIQSTCPPPPPFNQAGVFNAAYHLGDSSLWHLIYSKTSEANHTTCPALMSHCFDLRCPLRSITSFHPYNSITTKKGRRRKREEWKGKDERVNKYVVERANSDHWKPTDISDWRRGDCWLCWIVLNFCFVRWGCKWRLDAWIIAYLQYYSFTSDIWLQGKLVFVHQALRIYANMYIMYGNTSIGTNVHS